MIKLLEIRFPNSCFLLLQSPMETRIQLHWFLAIPECVFVSLRPCFAWMISPRLLKFYSAFISQALKPFPIPQGRIHYSQISARKSFGAWISYSPLFSKCLEQFVAYMYIFNIISVIGLTTLCKFKALLSVEHLRQSRPLLVRPSSMETMNSQKQCVAVFPLSSEDCSFHVSFLDDYSWEWK